MKHSQVETWECFWYNAIIRLDGMADEAYAVENAVEELKSIATQVIGNNNGDGVAKWLRENYDGKQ